MAINTRFATGVHALVLLAAEPDVLQTSEDVARKLNTNPVVIRRVFSLLQQAELVESQKGPSGGSPKAGVLALKVPSPHCTSPPSVCALKFPAGSSYIFHA